MNQKTIFMILSFLGVTIFGLYLLVIVIF